MSKIVITEDEIRAEMELGPREISVNNWAKHHEKSVHVHFSMEDDVWGQFMKKARKEGFSAASKLSKLMEGYIQNNESCSNRQIAKAIKLIHAAFKLLRSEIT